MSKCHDFRIIFWVIVLMLIAGCGKKTEQTITIPQKTTESKNLFLEQRYEELMQKDKALRKSLSGRGLDPFTRNIIQDIRMTNFSLIQIIIQQLREDNIELKQLLNSHRQLLQSELLAKEERYHYLLKEFVKVLPKPDKSQATPPKTAWVEKPPQRSRSNNTPLHGYPQQFAILIEVIDYRVGRNWLSLPREKEVTWIGERYEGRAAISILATPKGDVYEVKMPIVEDGFHWITARWKGRRN